MDSTDLLIAAGLLDNLAILALLRVAAAIRYDTAKLCADILAAWAG
jgi:hypothetical protein